MLAGLGCYAFAVYRHYGFYRSAPSQVGLALVLGCALFGEALLAQYFSQVYALSFWLYHALEFTGFGAISYAMLSGYRRGLDDEGLFESILLAGTRARLQAGYSKAMDALITTLSQGDQPTPAVRAALRAISLDREPNAGDRRGGARGGPGTAAAAGAGAVESGPA